MTHVKVYTTDYCSFCTAAKVLLKQLSIPFDEIDVTHDPEMRAKLVEWTQRRTVPQIFIREQPIGGFTDLKALHGSGKLKALLDGEGA